MITTDNDLSTHPYAPFLRNVERPARYIGGEWGMVRKPWNQTPYRVCLAFPDVYDVGMSHLGTRILYDLLNQPEDMLCERAFSPWLDMEQELRARQLPLLSLENARPLHQFDVVGISLQHELVYTNVLTLLDLGGVPLRASQRGEDEPLVVGGGSIATHPEPVAPFFDAFVVGDGEAKAEQVVRTWVDDRRRGVPRSERLAHLASLGGVYVPSLYRRQLDERSGRMVVTGPVSGDVPWPVRRAFVENLDDYPFPVVFPTGGPEAVFDRFSIEIARGCSQGCRFCQAGMIFRPERERSPRAVLDAIDKAIAETGQDEFSLTSLSPADYTAIGPLVHEASRHVNDKHVTMNVSSLRAYGLSDDILREIRQVRASNLTFAPEAGTQRLRDVINKNITEEQLLDTVQRVVRLGWNRIKLYFMLGLPTETDQDVAGIIELAAAARRVAREGKGKNRATRVTASVSTFVPKPHTPFQWSEMIGLDEIQRRQQLLRELARKARVDIKMHEPHASVLEGIMSRGDWRLADVIETVWRRGARFDAWDGYVDWETWTSALEEFGIDVDRWLASIPTEARLPWEHVAPGVDRDFLLRERNRALKGKTSLPCLRPADYVRNPSTDRVSATPDDKLVCLNCGLDCNMQGAAATRAKLGHQLDQDAEIPSRSTNAGRFERTEQPPVSTLRLNYAKKGKAAYWGHLDLVREMPRIFRRAGLELAYTQGFHPKPILNFASALQLGVEGLDEYVDVRVLGDPGLENILQRLNDQGPEGVEFLRYRSVAGPTTAVSKLAGLATYHIAMDETLVEQVGGVNTLEERIGQLVRAETIPVHREDKKRRRTRQFDARPLIEHLQLLDDTATSRISLPRACCAVQVTLRQEASGSLRLQELVALLLGKEPKGSKLAFEAVRVRVRGKQGEDLLELG